MSEFWFRDLEIFYISYDEPNCEENWRNVTSVLPHARRVHGVKGFETAHKTCAMQSLTERFVTIDGDNWLLPEAADTLLNDTGMEDVVFSFKSKNAINGLEYGNGGLKCWNRNILLNSSTHESSNTTDFCWALRYYQIDVLGSINVNNATPYQAWRAGYREGIKMSYLDGVPMKNPITEITLLHKGNASKLNLWMTVGRDVENGAWAMLGARQGFHELYSGVVENTVINDYDWFDRHWTKSSRVNLEPALERYSSLLQDQFNLFVPELDSSTSKWIKANYMHPPRKGLML